MTKSVNGIYIFLSSFENIARIGGIGVPSCSVNTYEERKDRKIRMEEFCEDGQRRDNG